VPVRPLHDAPQRGAEGEGLLTREGLLFRSDSLDTPPHLLRFVRRMASPRWPLPVDAHAYVHPPVIALPRGRSETSTAILGL
jgi:hypothetical protein